MNKTSCKTFWGTKHSFEKWKIIEEGDVTAYLKYSPEPVVTGSYIKQQRECSICGYTEIEKEKV